MAKMAKGYFSIWTFKKLVSNFQKMWKLGDKFALLTQTLSSWNQERVVQLALVETNYQFWTRRLAR